MELALTWLWKLLERAAKVVRIAQDPDPVSIHSHLFLNWDGN